MKIDERALEAACQEFKEWLYIPGKVEKEERAAINAAIRAYEAAKLRGRVRPCSFLLPQMRSKK